MEVFRVKKAFTISYAHRLLNYNGKCENLHGHNGKIEVIIEARKLDKQDMVKDFTEINRTVKKWLDENLDHRVILSEKDPLVNLMKKSNQKLFLTKDNPTAEILAKLIYKKLRDTGLNVSEVIFWETDTSMAHYINSGGKSGRK